MPFGVVAAITPWNAPIILSMLKVAPALVAGNAIVVKPSPFAPLAITAVVETLAAAPARRACSQVVHGDAETGEALVGAPARAQGGVHRRRRRGAAHRRDGRRAAITPTVMELGGNDAAIFLDDALLDDAALRPASCIASFATSGQVCMASKRIYVPRARFDEFVAGLRGGRASA